MSFPFQTLPNISHINSFLKYIINITHLNLNNYLNYGINIYTFF